MVDTIPRTWVAGEVVTAAMLNTEVRDFDTALQAPWSTWTPTLTNLTAGNGVLVARYLQMGRTVIFRLDFTAGSTSSFGGGTFAFSLPVALRSDYTSGLSAIGSGFLYDSSAGINSRTGATAYVNATGASSSVALVADRLSPGVVNASTPWTWAVNDTISFTGTYEAA